MCRLALCTRILLETVDRLIKLAHKNFDIGNTIRNFYILFFLDIVVQNSSVCILLLRHISDCDSHRENNPNGVHVFHGRVVKHIEIGRIKSRL